MKQIGLCVAIDFLCTRVYSANANANATVDLQITSNIPLYFRSDFCFRVVIIRYAVRAITKLSILFRITNVYTGDGSR